MSIRLQVLLDEEELEEIKRRAGEEHMSVSAWVRRALEHEKRERPSTAVRKKLELLHAAGRNDYPAGDYAEMAADISSVPSTPTSPRQSRCWSASFVTKSGS